MFERVNTASILIYWDTEPRYFVTDFSWDSHSAGAGAALLQPLLKSFMIQAMHDKLWMVY